MVNTYIITLGMLIKFNSIYYKQYLNIKSKTIEFLNVWVEQFFYDSHIA